MFLADETTLQGNDAEENVGKNGTRISGNNMKKKNHCGDSTNQIQAQSSPPTSFHTSLFFQPGSLKSPTRIRQEQQ
jgi:hypothetical protein